jgi:hypothetical protein
LSVRHEHLTTAVKIEYDGYKLALENVMLNQNGGGFFNVVRPEAQGQQA